LRGGGGCRERSGEEQMHQCMERGVGVGCGSYAYAGLREYVRGASAVSKVVAEGGARTPGSAAPPPRSADAQRAHRHAPPNARIETQEGWACERASGSERRRAEVSRGRLAVGVKGLRGGGWGGG
jgi:hypothetical protein